MSDREKQINKLKAKIYELLQNNEAVYVEKGHATTSYTLK